MDMNEKVEYKTFGNDIYMERVYCKSSGKSSKPKFKGVIGKVILSALAITLAIGNVTPALAAEVKTSPADYAKVVAFENGVSVESAISQIRGTVGDIQKNIDNGALTESNLMRLATQIYDLEKAVNKEPDGVEKAKVVLDEAERAIKGITSDGASKVKVAIATVRDSLKGYTTATVEQPLAGNMSITFSDMDSHKWALPYVTECVNRGAIQGTTTPVNGVGTFAPGGKVTLGEFITVFARLVAKDQIGSHQEGTHWATPYYEAAVKAGIIDPKEYDSTPEALNSPLTREEMAHIMVNVAYINGETLNIQKNTEKAVADYSTISARYVYDVLACYSNGLITGTDGIGTFSPKANMTRAEMATVVCRLMKYTDRATPKIPGDEVVEENMFSHDGYVSNDSQTKGMIIPEYSRKFECEALQAVRTGEDANGVYVVFTAPVLPEVLQEDFTFYFTADVEDAEGSYFADSINVSLKSGESKKVYFVSYFNESISKSEIALMSIGMHISNNVGKSMFSRQINSNNHSRAYGTWYNGVQDNCDLDSTAVWQGIGK